MTSAPTLSLSAELRAICGVEHVVDDPAALVSAQIGLDRMLPVVAVTPGSADEIAAILRLANDRGLCVVPAGGCTQQAAGMPPQMEILMYTSRLSQVAHYDAADLTVGVGAGTTIAQLSEIAAADHLLFALDPPLPQQCTVGGALATGIHGPLRHGYGSLRDFCIGVNFVTGDGRIGKGGGRVVKNVAGYDMMKLLIGSQGTLGVITSASFKLFPAPRQTRTFICEFGGIEEAVGFRNRVLLSPLAPICLELVSPEARKLMRPEMMDSAPWTVCLRAAGSDTVLSRYRTELGSAVSHEVNGENEQSIWRVLADFTRLVAERRPRSLAISLSLPLRDVQDALNNLESVARSAELSMACIGRLGVGHLLAGLWPLTDAEFPVESFAKAVAELRSYLPRDASMAVLSSPPEMHRHVKLWGPIPTDEKSMRAVKMALDPRNILNRGRFLF